LRQTSLFISIVCFTGLAAGQAARPVADTSYGPPRIGVIDFYGLSKVPQASVRKALGVTEGGLLPSSKGDAEERLDGVPGIVESHLEAVCCDDGKMILYIGVEERGAQHFELRDAPEGEVSLPEGITGAYREFIEALAAAIRRGSTAEDLTRGHSLMADPLAREIQEKFPSIARDHISELRDVLRNSQDEDQRAAAAYVIGYAPRKADIVDDLQYALRDSDPGVRANAVQGLLAVAVYAKLNPDAGIKIQPTWFIEMLNSLSWSDRSHAMKALQLLTDSREPLVLDQLRERALGSLTEMARWKTLAHALPAFMLVGRAAGLSEQQIQDAWSRGDRESVITAATSKKKAR
jgi:hypothetical protein